jgi:hypothetical protein
LLALVLAEVLAEVVVNETEHACLLCCYAVGRCCFLGSPFSVAGGCQFCLFLHLTADNIYLFTMRRPVSQVSQIGLFSLEQQGFVGKGASYSSSSFSSLQAPDQNAASASGAMSSRRQAQSSPEGSQGEMFKEGPIPLAAWQRT